MQYDINDFETDVIERSRQTPVLVDFWAAWCGPCRVIGPVLERLAAEAGDNWALAKVDTERFPEVSARYGVRSIPSVKLFIDGQVVDEFLGALPESQIRAWLARAVPSQSRKDVARAEELIAEGKIAEAQPLLETVVANERGNDQAATLLAQTFLGSDPDRAEQLVHRIREDSRFFIMAESIRTFVGLMRKRRQPEALPDSPTKAMYMEAINAVGRSDFDTALEKFIEIIRDDRLYDNDGARKACIAIFKILGESHPITRKHRRRFDGALYV